MEATFVIVGGGIAGVSCAETLAFLCPTERIILLTESSLIKTVTNLCPLGKTLSRFDVEERDSNTLKETIKIIVGVLAHINSNSKEITTQEGKKIKYKFLCLCTGARPKLIASDSEYVIGIRDTETVLEFQKRIKSAKRLILVGNGGIASEIAYEVKGVQIDWIVKDEHITSTFVDAAAAKFFQSKLQKKEAASKTPTTIKRMRYLDENAPGNKKGAALGPDWHRLLDINGTVTSMPQSVKIHYKNEIKEMQKIEKEESEFPLKVTLTNGEVLFCDFLVSATGVVPEISYTVDLEFKRGPDGGIFVNEMMETSIPGIYAAGDVCFAGWEHAKHWFQMRLWTQARQMGNMAGRSMAARFNDEQVYQDFCFELFGHVTTLFGYQVVLLGKYNGQGLGTNYEILLRITPDQEYIKFVLHDGKLQGAILIGETGLEETSENLILNQLDLSPYGEDILNPNIDIEDYFD